MRSMDVLNCCRLSFTAMRLISRTGAVAIVLPLQRVLGKLTIGKARAVKGATVARAGVRGKRSRIGACFRRICPRTSSTHRHHAGNARRRSANCAGIGDTGGEFGAEHHRAAQRDRQFSEIPSRTR